MEFSYKLTEAEYVQAVKLGGKASSQRVANTVMFWVFILACLMLLFSITEKSNQQASVPEEETTAETSKAEAPNQASLTQSLLVNVGPFVLLGGIWILVFVGLVPMRLRRIYRKDPAMQGEFTVSITPDSISVRNTAGTTWQSGWNIYERWREGKGLVVLVYYSRARFAMSMANLSETQRGELRGILSAALPAK
jgi:hypothetical protein